MQYSLLGNTGLLVSRLCFGAMTFRRHSERHAALANVGDRDAAAMVAAALDAGINFFDSADVYSEGESEELLGRALKSRRNDAIIATKVGMRAGAAVTQSGLARRHILQSVDDSLRRLGTDWIDVYIVHREDALTPLTETLKALDDIVRAGKVRYIGFSNWSAWAVSAALEMQKAQGWAKFSHGQMYYSLLCRDVEYDVVPMMQRYGIGMTVWSPLAGGFLSGKYTRENVSRGEGRRGGFDFPPVDFDHGFAVVDKLRLIAKSCGASVAQVALAWLLSNPIVTSVLLGASRLDQLQSNLGALEITLSEGDRQQLEALTALQPRYPNWFDAMVSDSAELAVMGRG